MALARLDMAFTTIPWFNKAIRIFSISILSLSRLYSICSKCILLCTCGRIVSISLLTTVMSYRVLTIFSPALAVTSAMSLWPVLAILRYPILRFNLLRSKFDVSEEDKR
ncbi:hypothetical protein M758_UG077000 [Ceratodon purpureus]|nr:hypothetical protein M758_UG077000 [Ceratodon purpureus]